MVEMKILTLISTGVGMPSFLVLQPLEKPVSEGKSRVVPICIGPYEARGVCKALGQETYARPTTHDLFVQAVAALGAHVSYALIDNMKNGTFYSKLHLEKPGQAFDLDARPSDAIALALRQGASIYIDEGLLERASFPYIYSRPFDEEQAVAEFKTFLDGLSPEDFL